MAVFHATPPEDLGSTKGFVRVRVAGRHSARAASVLPCLLSCANLLTQGPLHGMFLLLISKPAFYRWLSFAISWRLYDKQRLADQRAAEIAKRRADFNATNN